MPGPSPSPNPMVQRALPSSLRSLAGARATWLADGTSCLMFAPCAHATLSDAHFQGQDHDDDGDDQSQCILHALTAGNACSQG